MEVLEAPDGPAGLQQARGGSPDVILLDVMMPGLDGWRVAEELLADPGTSDIPIIFLTARAEFRDRARGLDIGGVDYVTKPFNPLELAQLVEGLLQRIGSGSDPPDDADAGLVPGEVCGDDGRAAVAPEGADARPDADPDEAGAEEIRAMLGAREPLVDDRSGTRHRADAPREVLADEGAA